MPRIESEVNQTLTRRALLSVLDLAGYGGAEERTACLADLILTIAENRDLLGGDIQLLQVRMQPLITELLISPPLAVDSFIVSDHQAIRWLINHALNGSGEQEIQALSTSCLEVAVSARPSLVAFASRCATAWQRTVQPVNGRHPEHAAEWVRWLIWHLTDLYRMGIFSPDSEMRGEVRSTLDERVTKDTPLGEFAVLLMRAYHSVLHAELEHIGDDADAETLARLGEEIALLETIALEPNGEPSQ